MDTTIAVTTDITKVFGRLELAIAGKTLAEAEAALELELKYVREDILLVLRKIYDEDALNAPLVVA